MLFRPEQKHGFSGKDNVLVPIAGRNGYMDDSLRSQQPAIPNLQQHFQIAAAAGGVNPGILSKHCRDAECIPDAVAIIRTIPHFHRECSRHSREGGGTPQVTTLLKHKCVTRAQALESYIQVFLRLEVSRHLGNTRRSTFRDQMAIDEQAKPSVKIDAYFLARIPISDVELGPTGQPRAAVPPRSA